MSPYRPTLETLYVGKRGVNPMSLAIYNKQLEQRERKNSYVDEYTRVELRFSDSKEDAKLANLLKALVFSYFLENGEVFRTKMFFEGLSNTLRFTNSTRDKGLTKVLSIFLLGG